MPKGQQLDKGKLRIHVGDKSVDKKLQKRKIRRTPFDEKPMPNRYSGGWAV